MNILTVYFLFFRLNEMQSLTHFSSYGVFLSLSGYRITVSKNIFFLFLLFFFITMNFTNNLFFF
ncbi:hypothetical protein RhiirC2_208015 [Rhizophagus irregularis]|uniref:Uncharacterized protein n=1 Tax=Rhizophagus irregularis TaxID=588596 RepID=A0A2N1P1X7_9GLOM|nr:hypothetical protein RhiirC2_208015 [Rhizophagus irregularis]